MSLPFNVAFTGIVQQYEKEIGANRGDIASNTNLLKEFTAQANLTLDDYIAMAIKSSGTWKFDDSNHTDYPEMTANLVANQRDYTFTTDEEGNLVLDIYRVYVKDGTSSAYRELTPVDPDSSSDYTGFTNGLSATGFPLLYDKTANAIRLDPIPSGNVTAGLKVSINREASYFTYTDTTRKAGVPGVHHKYFYLRPALDYARRNTLTSYPRLEGEVLKLESEIKEYFSARTKDEKPGLRPLYQNNK